MDPKNSVYDYRIPNPTILLGERYYEPHDQRITGGYTFHNDYYAKWFNNRSNGFRLYQNTILTHEFFHIFYNMNESQLANQLRNKFKADISQGRGGLQEWQARGCPKK
jgi:hypothetical protein